MCIQRLGCELLAAARAITAWRTSAQPADASAQHASMVPSMSGIPFPTCE